MNKLKILSVFGTRPEAIKMAPLVLELNSHPEIISQCCVTAQHREMLDSVLNIFNLVPDYDLNIMQHSQTITDITTRVLTGLDEVFDKAKPDLVLVHGDTTTTFAAALAAFYKKIPVGHVEAGLRSYDPYSPYPEEMNRRLVSQIAELFFCPTQRNKENLLREGITSGITVTGNTVIDAMKYTTSAEFHFKSQELEQINFSGYKTILLTAHRRENYGQPFANIFKAVKLLHDQFDDIQFIYPVHPSPSVREPAEKMLKCLDRVHLISPVTVDEMHNLIKRSYFVMTDSGGLQEEAPALGKPVLVLRKETERPEALEAGTAKLVGIETDDIFETALKLLTDSQFYNHMAKAVNPYGDGKACQRIVEAILSHYRGTTQPIEFTPQS